MTRPVRLSKHTPSDSNQVMCPERDITWPLPRTSATVVSQPGVPLFCEFKCSTVPLAGE
jgi:hypothetical protein